MTGKKIHSSRKSNVGFEASLGETVHHLRKTAGLSQIELGKLLGLHQAGVSRVEKGYQSLTPEQLYIISNYFKVNLDCVLGGHVNFWKVAEHFGKVPPLPERYLRFPYSKVREVLPLVRFANAEKGASFSRKVLQSLTVQEIQLGDPDMTMGAQFNLDFARKLIEAGELKGQSMSSVTRFARTEDTQGFLHQVYSTQENSLALIQSWVLNAHHYESNFRYTVEELTGRSFTLSVAAAPHMESIEYRDDVLGDFLCRYKKAYLGEFPAYIGHRPIQLQEKQCLFHGADRCVYEVKAS